MTSAVPFDPTRRRALRVPLVAALGVLLVCLAAYTGFTQAFWVAGLGLYTRLSAATLCDQVTRERILAHVRHHEGDSPSRIARALGVHRTTIRYHIRLLARERRVILRPVGRGLAVCTPGSGVASAAVPPSAFQRAETARRIVDVVRENPGLRVREISHVVGLHRVTVHYHVHRLSAAGVLRIEPRSHGLSLYAAAPSHS